MQLTDKTNGRAGLRAALGAMTAGLFLATGAGAQTAPAPVNMNDDTTTDAGLTRIDSAVLFYQEAGGRVQATEPVISMTLNDSDGDALNVKLTSDTLTGATPNGAAPWTGVQTFTTPTHTQGVQTTTTTASGNSKLVTIPGTDVKAAQYTAAANTLPMDYGFRDQRYAVDIGYSSQVDADTRLSLGGGYSTEHDYRSMTANAGASRDLNGKNTTVSLGLALELDQSRPYFGTPAPLTAMSGLAKGGNRSKTVVDLVAGVTQVMNRYWLAQVDYSLGSGSGYQTDPYRVISLVDPSSGAPQAYLYESRPGSRLRQSLYVGNKIALGPTVADLSLRAYHDSWGIHSLTFDLAERIPLTRWAYVEPHYRYYSQSAATFFHDYLLAGTALPAYASSDSRLGKFTATTAGVKIGVRAGPGELYARAETYAQKGVGHPPGAPGALAGENLFSGVRATSLVIGYSFAFR